MSALIRGARAVAAVRDQLAMRRVPNGLAEPDIAGIDVLVPGDTIQVKIARPQPAPRTGQPIVDVVHTRPVGPGRPRAVRPRSQASVFVFVLLQPLRFWIVRASEVWDIAASKPPRKRRSDYRGRNGAGRVAMVMRPEWEGQWSVIRGVPARPIKALVA